MKKSNSDKHLRKQGVHEERKRLIFLIEDDMERREEQENDMLDISFSHYFPPKPCCS